MALLGVSKHASITGGALILRLQIVIFMVARPLADRGGASSTAVGKFAGAPSLPHEQ
ncbi:hypothetical protein AB0B01_30550 [Streptomyces sp. NPDC044571]|uniref:hypothetical protein n=1 Tax=Streptomyces sp. NPDC044571 TaxID=3155371 RepID=UPI00340F628F